MEEKWKVVTFQFGIKDLCSEPGFKQMIFLKFLNFNVQLISVFHCNETDDSLCSARGMGNVFEASPSDSPEQPGQDHRAPDDSV